MIGRREVARGLGALLLAGAAPAGAFAQGKSMDKDASTETRKRLKDIPYTPLDQIPNHRQYMRDIVIALSTYAKKRNPQFLVLVRNGPELVVKEKREWNWESARDPQGAADGKYTPTGSVNRPYLKAIDGMLIDGLLFGEDEYGQPTNPDTRRILEAAAHALREDGRRVLAIEYCADKSKVEEAEALAGREGLLLYVDRDGDKALDRIPRERPLHENPEAVRDLAQARNFLPMLRSTGYGKRDDWVDALAATNYDLLLLDAFFHESDALVPADVGRLKYKRLGSDRMVLADLPLGRARDTRFYWQPDWAVGKPSFLVARDPEDPAEAMVNFWDPKWKEIIGKYMQGIMDLGVAGVVLDQVDAYLYFEALMPLE